VINLAKQDYTIRKLIEQSATSPVRLHHRLYWIRSLYHNIKLLVEYTDHGYQIMVSSIQTC